jgi:hypothetical protein
MGALIDARSAVAIPSVSAGDLPDGQISEIAV